MRWIPHGAPVGVGHQRDQARVLDALAVGALVVEPQAVGDRVGELVDRDLAGLGQVALGQGAGDRLAAVPQRQCALAVGGLLVVDRSTWRSPSQSRISLAASARVMPSASTSQSMREPWAPQP